MLVAERRRIVCSTEHRAVWLKCDWVLSMLLLCNVVQGSLTQQQQQLLHYLQQQQQQALTAVQQATSQVCLNC